MRTTYIIAIAVLIVGAGAITAWQFVSVRSEPAQAVATTDTPAGAGKMSGNPLLTMDKATLFLIMGQCGAELFAVEHVVAGMRETCTTTMQINAKRELGVSLSPADVADPQFRAHWLRLHNMTGPISKGWQ